MKSFDILYSLQVLTFVLYETGSVHLPSTINNRVVKECESIIHRGNGKNLYQKHPFDITKTVIKSGRISKESLLGKPHLAVNYTPNKVYEGQSVTLCCCSKRLAKSIEIWWRMNSSILSSKNDTNVHCHKIMNVSRNDSGVYRCFVDNEIGLLNAGVKIEVSYPPDIPDQHINVTENNVLRTLQCLANGVPAKYTYGQWKHLSFFGEYIRCLNSTFDGRVILPQIANKIKRYQDNGIYICTASNGVVDRTGNSFQNGKIFVIANGPPVFVEKIQYDQYDNLGRIFNLKFFVYSKSEIEWYNIKSENKETAASIQIIHVNSTTIFHGTEITIEAIEIVLSFNISQNSSSHMYTVTLCNGYGNNSFEVEIKSVLVEEKITHGTKVAIIIMLVILVMCVPISGAAVFLRRKRNRKRKRRVVDDIPESVEGQPVPVENIVYQAAIAFRPTPVQANGEVIEYNNETYSHEQTMRSLTGQLNYSEMYFQPSTSQDTRIIGIENRTVYSDVNNSERGSSGIDTQSISSSDEDDFVDIEGLENFIDRSEDI